MTVRIRTGYSFGVAFGHLSDVISRIKECGWSVAPITDHNSTFGFTQFAKLAAKEGIRPVYGVELSVVKAFGEAKPITDNWTFLAREDIRPLNELVARATAHPGKVPSLLYEHAIEAQGVFKIAGERVQLDLLPEALPDDLFFALSPALSKGLYNRILNKAGARFIASSENYYPRPEDGEIYRLALGRFKASKQTYPQWILSDAEWRATLEPLAPDAQLTAALEHRAIVLDGCSASLRKGELLRVKKERTLRSMCEEGASRKNVDLSDPIYSERLERELRLIAEKDYEDYFYILSDMVNWAKQHMLVGPARGSSCGSLVCYLINITEIDPIPYGLIFERFIDINRTDLPDIDIDFSDERRHLVFEYAENKYGADHVARLGTVGLFAPKSILLQAGAGLQIPKWRTNKVGDSIIERSSGDSRAMLQLEDTLNETEQGKLFLREHPEFAPAARIEGHPNNPSQHAAGIIITDKPIVNYVAVNSRTKSTMCVKKDAEILNLLKIDALGLTQLSIFERTLELIGQPVNNAFFNAIPLDDKEAFGVINDKRFAGIFQFTGTALKSLVSQIKVTSIDDMIIMTALARPGPLATGGAAAWIRRRNGEEPPATVHPMLTELTKETLGVVVFQETVMNIVRNMGNLSWEDTSAIRKAMSGRLGDEFFEGYWQKFLKGATENGVPEDNAKAVWDQVCTFGSWAFNKSHSVAYGIVSYWCCYLKAHWPLAFAAATLDAEKDPTKQLMLLKELAYEGIGYKPFDIEHSTLRWEIAERDGKQLLVGPLSTIKGIGPALANTIIACRKAKQELPAGIKKKLKDAKTPIDSLTPIADRIKELVPDLAAAGIFTEPTQIAKVFPGAVKEVVVIGVLRKLSPRDENEAVNVQKRGYRLNGPDQSINMFFADDTEEIFCKIGRFEYSRLADKVINNSKTGKSIFVIKGDVPNDFRMISVKNIKLLGEMS